MITFGERLRVARKNKNLTGLQLANLVGVATKQIVSNWENNSAKPTFETLIKISEVLEVSADYLLTGKRSYDVQVGKVNIALEDYVEYMQLKNEKLKKENASLKNPESVLL